jgi:hypothetical protein
LGHPIRYPPRLVTKRREHLGHTFLDKSDRADSAFPGQGKHPFGDLRFGSLTSVLGRRGMKKAPGSEIRSASRSQQTGRTRRKTLDNNRLHANGPGVVDNLHR